MHDRTTRVLAAALALLMMIMLASAPPTRTEAQAQAPAPPRPTDQVARTRPNRAAEAVLRSAAAPAATMPANMTQNVEGAGPATGWLLEDYGTSGGEYFFGKRNCEPLAGSFAGWAVGGGADGASLACGDNYPNDMYTIATYGPFSLANARTAVLKYNFTGASELEYDYLFVAASIDDYYYCGNFYSDDWSDSYYVDELDLSNLGCSGMPSTLLGQPNVTIAFFFVSDYNVNNIGFQVDNISLTTTLNQPTSTPTSR